MPDASVSASSLVSHIAAIFRQSMKHFTPAEAYSAIGLEPVTPVPDPKPSQKPPPSTRVHLVTTKRSLATLFELVPKGEFAGLNRDFFLNGWRSKYFTVKLAMS